MPECDIFAIAGFVLAFIFPIAGIILSRMALNRNTNYKSIAKAGFVLSIVITAISVIVLAVTFAIFFAALYNIPDNYQYLY